MNCPSCSSALRELREAGSAQGMAWLCTDCDDRLVELSVLRSYFGEEAIRALWQRASAGDTPTSHPCSPCDGAFRRWPERSGSSVIELDACPRCQTVWFDAGEMKKLASLDPPTPVAEKRPTFRVRRGVTGFDFLEGLGDFLASIVYFG